MNSKSLLDALTRSVPPFNAFFDAGLADRCDDADAVEAKIAVASITTPRTAKTPDSSAFLCIWLLSDVFSAGASDPRPHGPNGSTRGRCTSVRPTGVMASERN